jgi:hypothetical protein
MPDGKWAALTFTGELLEVGPSGILIQAQSLDLAGINLRQNVVLRLSPSGRLAAIAEDLGRRGCVFDLASETMIMPLLRDGYHTEFSPFPLAFTNFHGQELLVHGTAWNRLEVSNPLTGDCLTLREPNQYTAEVRPEHYLDYFHSSLLLSPDGRWIAEDGWMWHPLGIVRTWSLEAWVGGNVWESEDGPTVRELAQRAYFWNGPLCWMDNRRLAVWGFGDDELDLQPGIRIFDVVSGKEVASFPGPSVEPRDFRAKRVRDRGWIAFDKHLFAVSPGRGLEVWKVETQECLHQDRELGALAYHPQTKEFLSFSSGGANLSVLAEN